VTLMRARKCCEQEGKNFEGQGFSDLLHFVAVVVDDDFDIVVFRFEPRRVRTWRRDREPISSERGTKRENERVRKTIYFLTLC